MPRLQPLPPETTPELKPLVEVSLCNVCCLTGCFAW